MSTKLLGVSNAKTIKGLKRNVLTGILYLAPYNLSGWNVCPLASKGCAAACLFSAGRGKMNTVRNARIRKTKYFFTDRRSFMADVVSDIMYLKRKAERMGVDLAIRLNGTSDIRWENIPVDTEYTFRGETTLIRAASIMEAFPEVTFYDYTKLYNRRIAHLPNYSLTFSRSEENENKIETAFKNGMNVAVVFSTVPDSWKGRKVINGDDTDIRFMDPRNVVVGLTAKGDAKSDTSGFVVHPS